MQIIREGEDKYALIRVTPKYHAIVRILKRYDEDEQAINDMTKLLMGEITERDLLGSSYEQDVEAGRMGNRINVLEAVLGSIRADMLEAIGDNDKLDKTARETIKKINDLLE